nr:hypothetical protein [Tanacetum cinerariifolium]
MDLCDYEVSRVLVTCRSVLQLVILGVESRRVVPDWMLRLANDRVAWNKYPWGSYPTNEDVKTYSIFRYTWAFKTWILESFRITAIRYFDCYNRYPRVAAWSKKKRRNANAKHWTPLYISQPTNEDVKTYSILRYTWAFKVTSHMGRPNLQTTIETHHDVDGIFDQFPSKCKLNPFMEQPPTLILPKKHVNKTKDKGKKANLSPLNLGGAFEEDNVEDNNVMFLGSQFTCNFLMLENVDPTKDDRVCQLAMMNLAHEFNDASTAKDELGKAYEKCRDIPLEQRDLIEIFLKTEAELDYQMNNALLLKAE